VSQNVYPARSIGRIWIHEAHEDFMTARSCSIYIAALAIIFAFSAAHAQDSAAPPQSAVTPAPQTAQPDQQFEPNVIRAWSILTESSAPGKSAHDRIEAIAALGTMGADDRAAKIIGDAINGHDSDVRIAAILAAGQTKNPKLLPPLQRALDDDNAQVAYTAAITLWKMHDYTGEDLLSAVALGDRKASPGLIKSQRHKADKELHSPKALTMIAVNQGSGYFLGPFGVGVKAIEMVDKNSGAVIRAAAIDQLAQHHTGDVHDVLIADLTDGEPAVRAAAAKGLGRWPGPETAKALAPMFGDNHLAVRLTAAAAYLRAENNIATPPDCACDAP
jgi:HEAT repeat protein